MYQANRHARSRVAAFEIWAKDCLLSASSSPQNTETRASASWLIYLDFNLISVRITYPYGESFALGTTVYLGL
jgi:hypothetical protein